jgi:uncharacterized tellurite resistance protein B-like protein
MASPTPTPLTPVEICRFLCGIAWADNTITDGERGYILNLARLLGMSTQELSEVESWLDKPHDAAMLVPSRLSTEDRVALVQQALILSSADGTIAPTEENIIRAVEDLLELTGDERAELRLGVKHLFESLPASNV